MVSAPGTLLNEFLADLNPKKRSRTVRSGPNEERMIFERYFTAATSAANSSRALAFASASGTSPLSIFASNAFCAM